MSSNERSKLGMADDHAAVPRLVDELQKENYEPLLPVEKRLIGFSLGIGILLLGILVWTSRAAFHTPQTPAQPAATVPK